MDLNPWRQEDNYDKNRSGSLFMCLKTERMMDPKRKDDENEFVNYSIMSSKRYHDSE